MSMPSFAIVWGRPMCGQPARSDKTPSTLARNFLSSPRRLTLTYVGK
jgi:hypothetical protein